MKRFVLLFVCLFGLFGAGCSSLASWDRLDNKPKVVGDGVTPQSLEFTIYVAPGSDPLTADPVEVKYDLPGMEASTFLTRYTAESGSSEGVTGAILEQEKLGEITANPSDLKGRDHGNTARLVRVWYKPWTWLFPEERWGQLQTRMQNYHGVAFPLNKEGDKSSRTICFGLIEARDEAEYTEHLAHCPGAPATRLAFRTMYRANVKVKGADLASGGFSQ